MQISTFYFVTFLENMSVQIQSWQFPPCYSLSPAGSGWCMEGDDCDDDDESDDSETEDSY